jgi:carboxyl-terminal processing protease
MSLRAIPLGALFLLAAGTAASAQTGTPAHMGAAASADLESFEKVWSTIRDKHWQTKPGGLDWDTIHTEFRPRAERAAASPRSTEAMRAVLREMLARLGQTHFAIVPASTYALLAEGAPGEGVTGIDLRVLNGQAIVTRIDPGSPAEIAGVKPGWEILSAAGQEFEPLVEQARKDPSIHELNLTRALAARLSGEPGGSIHAVFLDGRERKVSLDLPLAAERGALATFGNLPPTHVWFESKRLDNITSIRFNLFLDLPRMMVNFETAVHNCKPCDGIIIDLRGNPGGIGGMAMGMAGFLTDKPDLKLGTMYMRDVSLKFVVNPRLEAFTGPLAILVDALSASTSEILAGGLKDLGRARIFGTKTAAAALPSQFERLPNGDGFQYAVANYISEGGKPLEGLGVAPDLEVKLTRDALLAGRDPVIEAALSWIQHQTTR